MTDKTTGRNTFKVYSEDDLCDQPFSSLEEALHSVNEGTKLYSYDATWIPWCTEELAAKFIKNMRKSHYKPLLDCDVDFDQEAAKLDAAELAELINNYAEAKGVKSLIYTLDESTKSEVIG